MKVNKKKTCEIASPEGQWPDSHNANACSMPVGKGESEIMKTPFTNIRSELLKLEEHELKAGTNEGYRKIIVL